MYTASTETATSPHTKKESVTTDVPKSTKVKPFHPPKESGALRMDQAKLIGTAAKDPTEMTKVEQHRIPSNQFGTKQITPEWLITGLVDTATQERKQEHRKSTKNQHNRQDRQNAKENTTAVLRGHCSNRE